MNPAVGSVASRVPTSSPSERINSRVAATAKPDSSAGAAGERARDVAQRIRADLLDEAGELEDLLVREAAEVVQRGRRAAADEAGERARR